MKLVDIGGYLINPAAIAYVSSKTIVSMSPQGRRQDAVLHFIGGGELQLSISAGAFAQALEKVQS